MILPETENVYQATVTVFNKEGKAELRVSTSDDCGVAFDLHTAELFLPLLMSFIEKGMI